ncbi:ATP-grasp fold amidoligase family protein [Serratia marcescens]|uniref:ATP-grasp fold amidoligase family protein n=1 Tax=Serratia marcescens TaxID=615 RepID=UPI0011E7AF3F|nr:ATP-grasp fold amidoligase family protein [Serratia marcescens]
MRKFVKYLYKVSPDFIYYQLSHYLVHESFVNFLNPKSFSEKIYHRMRYPREEFSLLADKVAVRDYISSRVSEKYLTPVILITKNFTEQDYLSLPQSFVIKTNNASQQVKIVRDKTRVGYDEIANTLKEWSRITYWKRFREKHYAKIPQQILVENLLDIERDGELIDYKVHVFNGSHPYLFVELLRGGPEPTSLEFLDRHAHHCFFTQKDIPQINTLREKPEFWDEMIEVAQAVAADLDYCRVDFYLTRDRLYIGELTLTPGAGNEVYQPRATNLLLGELMAKT